MAAAAEDAPDARGGPALFGLGRLLQTVRDAVDDGVDDLGVDAHAAVGVAAEELGKAADELAAVQRALVEVVGGRGARRAGAGRRR